jgi:glycosyltransferase involved in cell wall biosynthesis
MRILHIISTLDPAAGGPPGVAARLAAAQAALRHTVAIASHLRSGREEAVAASLQTVPSIDRVRLAYLPPDRTAALDRLAAEADVIHMHGLWERLLPATAAVARARSVPYVIAPHGMLYPWSLNQKRLKKRVALALGYRRMLNRAAFIHVLNADEQRAIEPLNLRPPARVVPNGVFTDEFRQLPPPGTFHRAHPQLAGRPYILFLSRLHPGKGLDHLGAAFPAVARAVPDLQLVVAGPDSGARAPFEQQIARAGLADRVHLVGPTYGQMKFAAFADACSFCLPSDHETFSMAIVEAMGCGVPVVISDACHFPEVADAGAGEIVPRDPGPLAAALTRVASDPARRQAMGRAGRDLVNDRFNWPDIARRCVDAYTDAIKDG